MKSTGFSVTKGLDKFKSLSTKDLSYSFPSRSPSSDSIPLGSFTNLKFTAEKLVKEQASVKTDLDIANAKLKKSTDYLKTLEEKLQIAFNENAKLKVKLMEDDKLWKGLDNKFTFTVSLCDQLRETLQLLTTQVHNAENDKKIIEGKFSASSNAVDNLKQQFNCVSSRLNAAEELNRIRDRELEELKTESEEQNRIHIHERGKLATLKEEKNCLLKGFEETLEASELRIESLRSEVEGYQNELKIKEEEVHNLKSEQEQLEKEKCELELICDNHADKLTLSLKEKQDLMDFIDICATHLRDMDRKSLNFCEKYTELVTLSEVALELALKEKRLAFERASQLYDQLSKKLICIESENKIMQSNNAELHGKILELQTALESSMEKASEEQHSTEGKLRKLELEIKFLQIKKSEADSTISELKEKMSKMEDLSKLSEKKMKELRGTISNLEIEKKNVADKLAAEMHDNRTTCDTLKQEKERQETKAESLEKEVAQLCTSVQQKEQTILRYQEKEKKIENQVFEMQSLLSSNEDKLAEAKKQYDMMLETKQLELSRHLKDICQRNDHAINEMQHKYESEKLEIVKKEKEKADKAIEEIELSCAKRSSECEEQVKQSLIRIQEEHTALILQIQQENDKREAITKINHNEEIKRILYQAETELKEKTMQLRNEHDVQITALKCQHEDECKKFLEELELQKTKEDRQRALLQLQWRVMSDEPQEDQEGDSKPEYSISSIKMRDAACRTRRHRKLIRSSHGKKELPLRRVTGTPVTSIIKDVEDCKTATMMSIPQHHKRVTHHEYEVETSNGRTITKRRKTRSTVMFEDSKKPKTMFTPKVLTPKSAGKESKNVSRQGRSNIGDLFTEGSLNPYADDPYAFD